MEITILDNQLQKVAIVDDYVSLIWSKRYYDIGALDLEIEASTKNLSIFRKGYYITRKDDDAIYVIKALEIDTKENNDNSLIVGAYDCKEILQRRIIWKTVVFSGTVENYIRKLITDNVINPSATNRKINNFQLKAAKGYTERIDQQVTYNNLADKITEICTTFGYGWKVTLENGAFCFDLYKGVDHSTDQEDNIKLIFSPDNENIISTKYKTDDSNFKNVALVGGEGEGTDRKLRTIGSAAGINRYETFIDASGLSTNTEEGDLVDYYNALIAEGKEKLSEQAVVTSFEGEVDTNSYKYKTDYNLGDIVTVKNEYGIMAHARITEVIETWDDEGYTVEPKFEYFEPIDFEVPVEGALLTENRMMLMSEVGNMPLEVEESESHTGVKISELDELLAVDDGCCLPVVHGTGTRKVRLGTIFDKIRSWLGNGTLTIKRNGVLVNTFAANQSSNAEVNIEVPTDYLPKSGGTMTGDISYKGSKSTFPMIKWIDNTADTFGNGINIGGGGAVVIGSGESQDVTVANAITSGGDEKTFVTSDNEVKIMSNMQSGWDGRKEFVFDNDGQIVLPDGYDSVTANQKHAEIRTTHNGSITPLGCGSWAWNIAGRPSVTVQNVTSGFTATLINAFRRGNILHVKISVVTNHNIAVNNYDTQDIKITIPSNCTFNGDFEINEIGYYGNNHVIAWYNGDYKGDDTPQSKGIRFRWQTGGTAFAAGSSVSINLRLPLGNYPINA